VERKKSVCAFVVIFCSYTFKVLLMSLNNFKMDLQKRIETIRKRVAENKAFNPNCFGVALYLAGFSDNLASIRRIGAEAVLGEELTLPQPGCFVTFRSSKRYMELHHLGIILNGNPKEMAHYHSNTGLVLDENIKAFQEKHYKGYMVKYYQANQQTS